jgi:lipopolysaccharide export LptBFGC system permease protein LptF
LIPYVDRDLLRSFFIAFICLMIFVQVGIFVSFLMNMYSDVFGTAENKFFWFLLYYFFQLPRQLANTIPVGAAVSVLLVYAMKARQNELLAYMVGGVSPLRLARPMLVVTFLLSLASYATTEFLASSGDAEAERIKRVIIEERSEDSLTRERNVFQKGKGDRFYMIHTFQPAQNRMIFPVVYDLRPDWKGMFWSLEAESAEYVENGSSGEWHFEDAIFRQYDEQGEVVAYKRHRQGTEATILPPDVRLEEELARYIKQRWRPSQMNALELIDYIDLFETQNKPSYELKTYLHFNIATALGCFVLACLMIGHILRPASTGVLVGFGGGLVLIAIYYIVFLFARNASMVGTVPAFLAAQTPNILFILVATFMLSRHRTG